MTEESLCVTPGCGKLITQEKGDPWFHTDTGEELSFPGERDDEFATPPDIHKATPADPDTHYTSCAVCKEMVRKVPGGQGMTWVHDTTGFVVGRGRPS